MKHGSLSSYDSIGYGDCEWLEDEGDELFESDDFEGAWAITALTSDLG